MTERVYVDYPEGSFKDRCFQEMVRKFGKVTAGDIFWLEEEVCCLYQPPRRSMLLVDLRAIEQLVGALISRVETDMEVENDQRGS